MSTLFGELIYHCIVIIIMLCAMATLFEFFVSVSGAQPTLKSLLDRDFAPIRAIPYISFMRYSLEALYVNEVQYYSSAVSLQGVDLATQVCTICTGICVAAQQTANERHTLEYSNTSTFSCLRYRRRL